MRKSIYIEFGDNNELRFFDQSKGRLLKTVLVEPQVVADLKLLVIQASGVYPSTGKPRTTPIKFEYMTRTKKITYDIRVSGETVPTDIDIDVIEYTYVECPINEADIMTEWAGAWIAGDTHNWVIQSGMANRSQLTIQTSEIDKYY